MGKKKTANFPKRALVIAPQPFFSPRGTPFSVYYRTLVMAEMGVRADVVTYGEGQDVDIEGVRIIRIPRFRFLGRVKIGPSFLKLFLDIFIVLWTIGLLLRNQYDFVHAHEESVFFCRFLKPLFGFKLVYDMHSSLPQQLTNFNFTKSKFLITLFERLEDSCLGASDAIITICPDLSDYVKRSGHDQRKHVLIENSIYEPVRMRIQDKEDAQPTLVEANRELDLPENKRLVVYAGTLEPYQGIDILIKAWTRVLDSTADAFLVIVGGSVEQVEGYRRLASELGLDGSLRFTGRVPQTVAKQYCGAASVLVSPRSSGTNTPLKVYEQLASGIPLVATRVYSHTQVLNDDTAILVAPDPFALAGGILRALEAKGHVQTIVTNARRYYEENYSRPIYEEKISKVLKVLDSCAV